MRWIGRALLLLIVALLVLAVSGAIYQAIATERAERAYPPPGEMVDVGGYSLHINCVGQGSPTVVLDAGSGEMSAHWVWVQREVSDTTRVCAYDRAGMGWSEMGPQPRDAKQISSELHALLTKAGIDGPYVLVGHSFGGLYMQTYAARYPDEVAGVSLVESSHPEQFSYRPVARDSYEPQKQIFAVVPRLARLGVSLPARLGVVRLLSKLDPASHELPQQQREQIEGVAELACLADEGDGDDRAGQGAEVQGGAAVGLGDGAHAGGLEVELLGGQGRQRLLARQRIGRLVHGIPFPT